MDKSTHCPVRLCCREEEWENSVQAGPASDMGDIGHCSGCHLVGGIRRALPLRSHLSLWWAKHKTKWVPNFSEREVVACWVCSRWFSGNFIFKQLLLQCDFLCVKVGVWLNYHQWYDLVDEFSLHPSGSMMLKQKSVVNKLISLLSKVTKFCL